MGGSWPSLQKPARRWFARNSPGRWRVLVSMVDAQSAHGVLGMELTRVVSALKTPGHLAKQYLHRRTDPNYHCDFVAEVEKARAAALAETMRREGIVILPGYFQPPKLDVLRAAFERVTSDKINKYSPDSLWTDDIFSFEPALLDAALDDFLLQVVGN